MGGTLCCSYVYLIHNMSLKLSLLFAPFMFATRVFAQDNYEIQVYDAPTVKKGNTMFELHSNFTSVGKQVNPNDGGVSTDLQWRETVEISQGITDWFEIGGYLFLTGTKGNYALAYVGDHIRPRVCAPASWNWPLGVSISTEIGYQRIKYAEDTWTWEIRPILSKEWKNLAIDFNPAIEYSIKGLNHDAGPQFAPGLKVSYAFTKLVAVGLEYYGDIGSFRKPDPLATQQHQLGLVFDLDVSPEWEINFGYIFGLTPATDRVIAKMIVGRRVDWHRHKKKT